MAEKGKPEDKSNNPNSDLMDKDINFDNRDMHKTWPLVKGCGMLLGGVVGFILISKYVFKHFANWF